MSDGPKLASNVLVVDDDSLRLLMVKRNARGTFSSALVLPGGVVDDDDANIEWLPTLNAPKSWGDSERMVRVAAVRSV